MHVADKPSIRSERGPGMARAARKPKLMLSVIGTLLSGFDGHRALEPPYQTPPREYVNSPRRII
jgi:hypothetical protein